MTDSLEGLPLELRKAAVTINQAKDVLFEYMIDSKISEEEFGRKVTKLMDEELWLPAGLVEQERQRIKEAFKKYFLEVKERFTDVSFHSVAVGNEPPRKSMPSVMGRKYALKAIHDFEQKVEEALR